MQTDLFTNAPALASLTLRVLDEAEVDALCNAVVTTMVHQALDPDEDPPGEPGPWPERETAFSILLQPCGSCADAIPVLGPCVCQACYEGGHCPICAEQHGAKLCPEVAAIWQEQEAIEKAAARQRCVEKAARWTAEDWDADTKAGKWSKELPHG